MSTVKISSTTHVAGPVVYFKSLDRLIQRCAVCGLKLCDSLGTAQPIRPGEEPMPYPTWGERRLVQVSGNQSVDVGDFIDEPIPDDFCLALVEP